MHMHTLLRHTLSRHTPARTAPRPDPWARYSLPFSPHAWPRRSLHTPPPSTPPLPEVPGGSVFETKPNSQKRQYYIENKETFSEYKRKNKEAIKEHQKQYRSKNKLSIQENKRTYYIRNLEKIKQKRAQNSIRIKCQREDYYRRNREAIKRRNRTDYLRKRKERKNRAWGDPGEVRRFFEGAGERLCVREPGDWYRVSRQQIDEVGGKSLYSRFGNLGRALKFAFPEMEWDEERFSFRGKKAEQRRLKMVLSQILPADTLIVEDYLHPLLLWDDNKKMELDIWVPAFNLGLEYQGEHHYSDLHSAFGPNGTLGLYAERDAKKKKTCAEKGVTLVTIPYWWDGKQDSLQSTLALVLPDLFQVNTVVPPKPEETSAKEDVMMDKESNIAPPSNASSIEPSNERNIAPPSNTSNIEPPNNAKNIETPNNAKNIETPNAKNVETPNNARKIEPPSEGNIESPNNSRNIEPPSSAKNIETPSSARKIEPPSNARSSLAPNIDHFTPQFGFKLNNYLSLQVASLLMHGREWNEEQDPTDWLISEKLDGFRAFWDGSQLYSKNGKVIPIPSDFASLLPRHICLDGELWTGYDKFNDLQAIFKKSQTLQSDSQQFYELWKDVKYCVFDAPRHHGRYAERHAFANASISSCDSSICMIPFERCLGMEHLQTRLNLVTEKKGEGLMLYHPTAPYTPGRNNNILKVKAYAEEDVKLLKINPNSYSFLCEQKNGATCIVKCGGWDYLNPPSSGTVLTVRHNGYFKTSKKMKYPFLWRIRNDLNWDQVKASS